MHSTRSHLLYTKWKVTLIAAGPRTISDIVLSAPVTTIFACLLPRVLACSATKRKKKREEWRGGGEGRWRGLETQARASLSKPPRSPNDCERFTRGRGFLPSSLFEKRVGQSVGDKREKERGRGANWLETDERSEREREGGGREWQQALVHYGQCFLNCC